MTFFHYSRPIQALIDAAVLTLETVINSHYSHIVVLPTELHLAADAIVRLMLSHITRPASSPSTASAEIRRSSYHWPPLIRITD